MVRLAVVMVALIVEAAISILISVTLVFLAPIVGSSFKGGRLRYPTIRAAQQGLEMALIDEIDCLVIREVVG